MNVELRSLSTDFEIGRTSTPQVGTTQQQHARKAGRSGKRHTNVIDTRLAITELEGRQQLGAHESRKPFKVEKKEKEKKKKTRKPPKKIGQARHLEFSLMTSNLCFCPKNYKTMNLCFKLIVAATIRNYSL